jgi:hypothetical protein
VGKKKLTRSQEIKHEEGFIVFLEKRLASKNFKNNVTDEEFKKTQEKLSKARLKLRLLKGEF